MPCFHNASNAGILQARLSKATSPLVFPPALRSNHRERTLTSPFARANTRSTRPLLRPKPPSVTDTEPLHSVVADSDRIALVIMKVRTDHSEHVNHFSFYAVSRRVAMSCGEVFCITNDRYIAVWLVYAGSFSCAITNHVVTAPGPSRRGLFLASRTGLILDSAPSMIIFDRSIYWEASKRRRRHLSTWEPSLHTSIIIEDLELYGFHGFFDEEQRFGSKNSYLTSLQIWLPQKLI